MKEIIDIIIPFYNTPIDDFARCLESIKNQTYSFWKIILIDDGSKNEFAEKLDEFALNDKRINVYHIKNGGISNARNYGIKRITSPFFCFCDSDDELVSDYLENALYLMQKNDVDMVIGGVKVLSNKEICKECSSNKGINIIENDRIPLLIDYMIATVQYSENEFLNNIYLGRAYPKLYRSDRFFNICFEEKVTVHEDNLYSFDTLFNSRSICITSQMYYSYWQNDYSITHHVIKQQDLENEVLFLDSFLRRINEDEKYYDSIFVRLSIVISTIIEMACALNYSKKSLKRLIIDLLSKDNIEMIIQKSDYKKYIGLKGKIGSRAFFVCKLLKIKNKKITSWGLTMFSYLYRKK